jgi:hypothetical protein
MEKLRNDIKAVFSRQQSGLGYTAGVSDRLLRQALAPAPVRRSLAPQLAAALATLVLGAALAYVVVVTHGHLKSQSPVTRVMPSVRPSASATAIPAPTPLARTFVVPSTTPALLYFDPVDSQQVDGVTWDGAQRGRIGDLGSASSLYQNPSGTLFSTFRDIRDRSGQVVAASMTLGNNKGFTWADDGQHYCQIVSRSAIPPAGGEPGTLRVITISGSVRNVAQVGVMGDQFGSGVTACSFERDRAVVTETNSIGATTQIWAVQLTTGRILWSRSLASAPVYVSASRDGQWVAIPSVDGAMTTIYGSTGAVAGHVNGSVRGFSWDGSLVVLGDYAGARTMVSRWRDNTVLWTAPQGATYSQDLPEPGGSRVAVAVMVPGHPQTGGYPTVDVYAISPDGTAVQILSDVSL